MTGLSRDQWQTILDDAEPATYGELVATLEERDLVPDDPAALVDAAIEAGELVEDCDGAWTTLHVPDEGAENARAGSEDRSDDDLSTAPPTVDSWQAVAFDAPEPGQWAPPQMEYSQWMCRKGGKNPFSPWTDPDAPVVCNRSEHDEGTTCADCEHHAGYKWGSEGSAEYVHADHETALDWATKEPTLSDDLVFIQRDDDPFAFVDGDDVRDPDTGEVHPAFLAILEQLGLTYADVSTSGSGVHAVYRGEIPLDGQGQATFELDDEPWGANDEPPAVEIYANKHVNIATGEHLPGTGTEVREWNTDALRAILEAAGYTDAPAGPSAADEFNTDDHDPDATASDELTGDIKDIYHALDRIDARKVADDTIVHEWNDDANTSGKNRAFVPTWGTNANGTANIVGEDIWQDTGGKGYGGPAVMAAIDSSQTTADERTQPADVDGQMWLEAVDHLRDELGYSIPVWIPAADSGYHDSEQTPYWAVRKAALALGIVDEADLVDRDGDNGGTYRALPDAAAYNATLDALEDHGIDHGRDRVATGDGYEETADPRDLFDETVVVEPRDAWRAAGAVRPDDLEPDDDERELPLPITDDGDGWLTDDGQRINDIVVAVAYAENLINAPGERIDTPIFDEAYRRARRAYAAPLPEYVDETQATDQRWVLQGALRQIDHWKLDRIRSPVTGTGDAQDVVAEINPIWEYSASGRRILAFRSGWFYCREHDVSLDPLRFVALEEGILSDCHDDFADGEAFLDAVDALRQRGAPVPQYEADTVDREAILPDPDALLEEFTTDADRLQHARDQVEALIDDVAADSTSADLVTALPALGKTTSIVTNAESRPTLYAAPRKELQRDVVEKAAEHGVSAYVLPVFAEDHITRDAKAEGAAAVREQGQQLLRDGEALLECIESPIHPDPDAEDLDEEEITLDRASCNTANGAHGEAWQVRVQVAVELGFSPEFIHTHAKALFGEDIPCDDDHDDSHGQCPYQQAWERVADPDRPIDLLVGSRTHAYVRSARTWYGRDDGRVDVEARTVAIDEFPEGAYGQEFGEEAPTMATWLATALRADLDAERDVLEADLWDTWVRDWVHGADEAVPELSHLTPYLDVCRALLDARDAAADLQTDDRPDALEALRAAVDRGLGTDAEADDIYALADAALASVRGGELPDELAHEIAVALNDALDALSSITGAVGDPDLSAGGEQLGETFRSLITTALTGALEAGEDHALTTARDACRGGEAGTAALAVHADDPYAHPDAYLLLAGMISDGEVIETSDFRFDPCKPRTRLTRTRVDGATVLFDRDHDGAYILDPPEFVDTRGRDCPVVGLDATGRESLWSLAIGEDMSERDIHDSARERREFLRDVLNLQVVQAARHVNSYSSPTNTNFDADVSLIRNIAEQYGSGRDGRLRANTLSPTTDPGVITTKKARQHLENRIADHASAIDHYGNVTGSNELGECNLGSVLGSRHFGDEPVEKWAALAGEEVTRTGWGDDLSYGSEIGDAFLAHMREDETMQAILRFGRDEEGALVFARTSALREDLPVVADAAVVSAHSQAGIQVRDAMRPYLERGRKFTVSDIVDDVDASRRTVQRKLREFANLGYLERWDPGVGRANEFTPEADPGVGDVELPELGEPGPHPDESHEEEYNTGIVGVRDGDHTVRRAPKGGRAQLPAPDASDGGSTASAPPG